MFLAVVIVVVVIIIIITLIKEFSNFLMNERIEKVINKNNHLKKFQPLLRRMIKFY